MEKKTMLNEYAKIFEIYNEEMMKDMYMGKKNELGNVKLYKPAYTNYENAKIIGKNYSDKRNDIDASGNSIKTNKEVYEHDNKNSLRTTKNDLINYKESIQNRNNNKTTNNTSATYIPLDAYKKKSEIEKEKENEQNISKHNIKECKKNNSKDNNHINVCKACYLQRVQDEICGLKDKKKRTTTYPREFNHFLKYENISEAIAFKKEKIMLYHQMKEPQRCIDNNESYNNEVMKELSEQISLKRDMFNFLNRIIIRN